MSHKDLVLLFYDGYELKAREGLVGQTFSAAHRAARYSYRSLRSRQVRTGFYTAFLALERCLRLAGCDVRVNDFAMARANPRHPIGVGGYVSVLDHTGSLPNPRIFGPGDFGDPQASAAVARDERWKRHIQPCDWFIEMYRPYCGDKMMRWFAGIDTTRFADASAHEKSIDVLIYDKVRWNYDDWSTRLIDPIHTHLDRLKLTHRTVRYGHHHQAEFLDGLRRARSMLFLCEHETQGLAYQEAMSMNVPILAWDETALVDPFLRSQASPDLRVTSVPYFDERCGATFKRDDFATAFDRFWDERSNFQPRAYVEEELSMSRSAELYLKTYRSLSPSKA